MWDLPGSGIKPVSPALADGFFTTESPGKLSIFFLIFIFIFKIYFFQDNTKIYNSVNYYKIGNEHPGSHFHHQFSIVRKSVLFKVLLGFNTSPLEIPADFFFW